MALKPIVEKLEEVVEGIRGEYRPLTAEEARASGVSAGFVLNVEAVKGWGLEHIDGLKRSNENLRTHERKLKEYGEITPEDAKRHSQELSELREQLKSKGKIDETAWAAREKELVGLHASKENAWNEARTMLEKDLQEQVVDNRWKSALSKAGFTKHAGQISKLTRDQLRMKRNADGKPDVVIVREDGKTERIGDPTGRLMTLDEYAVEIRNSDDYRDFLDGTGATGSGANGATKSAPNMYVNGGMLTLSRADAHDPQKYQAAKAQAEKSGMTLQLGTT